MAHQQRERRTGGRLWMKGEWKPGQQEETEVADAQASEALIGHSGLFLTLPGLLTVKPPVRTQLRKSPVGTQHLLWASKLCWGAELRSHLPKAVTAVASGSPSFLKAEWVDMTGGWAGKRVRILAYEASPWPTVPWMSSHPCFPGSMAPERAEKEPCLLSAGPCHVCNYHCWTSKGGRGGRKHWRRKLTTAVAQNRKG